MISNEFEKIKQRVPVLYLLDKAIEQETNVTYTQLRAKRGGTDFTSLCRLIYANIATLATARLTIRDIAIVLNVSRRQTTLYKRKIMDLLRSDVSFNELYNRIYNRFKQLKTEKENELD